ncbi:MAG: GNAT family N-acetyltransferase [Deltaproteobacteria bacterium]|jgi:ribosomal protein S18 acetylase RimI-like enzyme|nr:GNAT family N-acetyltransferase [Deltaproteobacteria bacterium]MBT4525660.1 GNAT family N-acetyltransferase [Deltaproteobacteria bacterium]
MIIEVDENPNDRDIQKLRSHLLQFNLNHLDVKSRPPIAIWCKDKAQTITAGIAGDTFGNWLEIHFLWVQEELRKSGTGKKLLLKMEEIAKIRGCLYVKVDIYDFQAKSFYEKNGYKVIFSLSDYPFSGEKHYLTKN